MSDILLGVLLGFGLGGFAGLYFAGRQFGRQLKAEIEAGRLSRTDATRIAEMPAARTHDRA